MAKNKGVIAKKIVSQQVSGNFWRAVYEVWVQDGRGGRGGDEMGEGGWQWVELWWVISTQAPRYSDIKLNPRVGPILPAVY